jgi:hypothetical protein
VEEVKFLASRQAPPPDGKRKFTRFRFELPVTVEFTDSGSANTVEGCMLNISADGLCFTSYHWFEPAQKISITLQTQKTHYTICATVVHTARFLALYKIGVKFNLEEK